MLVKNVRTRGWLVLLDYAVLFVTFGQMQLRGTTGGPFCRQKAKRAQRVQRVVTPMQG